MTATTHLALPLIAAGQAQKHVTHNEALLAVDALLHCAVKDKDLAAPPAAPAEGDRYIVAAAPSGAWAGKAGQVAAWQDGLWRFHAPKVGWIAFVVDEMQLYRFDGAAWAPGIGAITNLQNLTLLGVGTTADATNPFSAKLNNVLHTAKAVAEGGTGDLRIKLSKEAAAKTASFLFQTNFSGRAELGLAGDDDFHLKVSPDGAAWKEAVVVDRTTGATRLPHYKPRGLFHAYRNTNQTGFVVGFNKLQLETEEVDADGWYDNAANHRYTPQESGWYFFYCDVQVTYSAASTEGVAAAVYKNGAVERQGGPMLVLNTSSITLGTANVCALVQMNGSTDYVEFFVYVGGGSGGGATSGGRVRNYGGGFKVSGL